MKKYSEAIVKVILFSEELVRTSVVGDDYEEDIFPEKTQFNA